MKRIIRAPTGTISYEDAMFDHLVAGRGSSSASGVGHDVLLRYPLRLSFYDEFPVHEIRLEILERLAISRLKLLKAIENYYARIQHGGVSDAHFISSAEERLMPLHSNAAHKGYPLDEERLNDITSHFILRLAYCRREESRRWFVNQEAAMLRWRFQHLLGSEEKSKFIEKHFPQLQYISDDEIASVTNNLMATTPLIASDSSEHRQQQYYKVPWENVPDLVGRRSVFLNNGWAFVHRSEVLSIINSAFKAMLERDLIEMSSSLPFIENDERIFSLLDAISAGLDDTIDSSAAMLTSKMERLSASDVDRVAIHFPPCMLQINGKLRKESHLKHGGRMQFGLFLKVSLNALYFQSIGLNLDDAIVFWKKAFSKKTTDDSFQKNYLYNIRHNYGQEGKRTNYPPYSCHRIITGTSPAAGDTHGCPFRHQSPDLLASWLSQAYGSSSVSSSSAFKPLSTETLKEVMSISTSGHYQLACTRLLESVRGGSICSATAKTGASDGVITYPNQFYEHSVACCRQN
ncbi:DNA primase subunit pri2 [Mitosporidium daphniae]